MAGKIVVSDKIGKIHVRSVFNRITLSLISFAMVLIGASAAHSFCFEEAEAEYGVSADLLKAIALHESGNNPGAIHYNKNGSYDFGLMQINSCWYGTLGHERWMELGDPCFNVRTGAWILKGCIKRFGYTWKAVGCYNAGSEDKRKSYAWIIRNTWKNKSSKKGKNT